MAVTDTDEAARLIDEAIAPGRQSINYTPGDWFEAQTIDEMQAFYKSRLEAIREAARKCGYAIGVHGSERRDYDLIAMQWTEGASDKDDLARAIAIAACGIARDGGYEWEAKPQGRFATSIPICWTAWHDMISAGHLDLSVVDSVLSPIPGDVAGLCKRLRALVIMDEVCSDNPLGREAAAALEAQAAEIERLTKERDNARSEVSWLGKLLMRTRAAFGYIVSEMEDEGDRVYFGSTNHAEELRDLRDKSETWDECRIMRAEQWPDYITKCNEQHKRAGAAEAEIERLKKALKNTTVSLVAAHSLLSEGGKKAAPSDTMFEIMMSDYWRSIEQARAALDTLARTEETE